MERRLAAIMLTDIVGYSRLIGLDEEGTVARQKAHRQEVFDPKISEHGGRIVKSTGDGLLVEYSSVVDAVTCAIEVQCELAGRYIDVPEEQRIQYRIGINLGDILIDGEDILGDGVNIAARLEGLARPGGICVSGSVHEQLAGKLDAVFEDAGEQPVKNVPRPVRVWHWQADGTVRRLSDVNDLPALPDKPSIAVLPFENMSGDPQQEYIADGIADDVITGLSKFKSLFVIARSSSFSFKGRHIDVRQIASDFGVRYVVEGSLRVAGNRVRVSGQLVDAETGNHIWADRFDESLEDIFDIQDQITNVIIQAVEPEISKAERDRARRIPPNSIDAWVQFQRGLHAYFSTVEDDLLAATEIFDAVSKLDPNFAPAYAMAADTRSRLVVHYHSDNATKLLAEAEKLAARAIKLEPHDAVGYWSDGRVKSMQRRFQEAIHQLEKSISLNPNHAMAFHALGYTYANAGQAERALEMQDQAIRISPHDAFLGGFLSIKGSALLQLGRIEEAEAVARQALRTPNPRYWIYAQLAIALAETGRRAEAQEIASQLFNLKPDFLEHVARLDQPGIKVFGEMFEKHGLNETKGI